MKILNLLSLLLLTQTGEPITESIKNWKVFPVPDKELARTYNMGNPDWTIFEKNGELYATTDRYFVPNELPFKIKPGKADGNSLAGKRSVVKVEDGYLVGFNRGEWGVTFGGFQKMVNSDMKFQMISSCHLPNLITRSTPFKASLI